MVSVDANVSSSAEGAPHGGSLKDRLFEEVKNALLIALYLWAFLAAFRLYRTVIIDDNWRDYWGQGLAVINALVLAKVIVIGDALKIGPRLQRSRRVWFILSQALVFALLLIAFHIAEDLVKGMLNHKGIETALEALSGPRLRATLAASAVFFLVLIPFFAFREFTRVLGAKTVVDLLFSRDDRDHPVVARD